MSDTPRTDALMAKFNPSVHDMTPLSQLAQVYQGLHDTERELADAKRSLSEEQRKLKLALLEVDLVAARYAHDRDAYAEKFARAFVDASTGRYFAENGPELGDYLCTECEVRGNEPLHHKPECHVAEAEAFLAALSKNFTPSGQQPVPEGSTPASGSKTALPTPGPEEGEAPHGVGNPEPLYLLAYGGDGYDSRVVSESELLGAYLATVAGETIGGKPDSDDELRLAAADHFENNDSWQLADGKRFVFEEHFEDGWVTVTRIFERPRAVPSQFTAERGEFDRMTAWRAEKEASQAEDAARYRWLRSEEAATDPRYYPFWREFGAKLCREGKMDALIDEAMAVPVELPQSQGEKP